MPLPPRTARSIAALLIPALVSSALGLLAAGCAGNPSPVNINLRKQNQSLQDQNDELNRRHDADVATIAGLQDRTTTAPVLPQAELDQLFTTAGLKFGKLTGGDSDSGQTSDSRLKIYVTPIDQDGDSLKMAGTFHVELFDLNLKNDNRIGTWDFDLEKARRSWLGPGMLVSLNEYVLDCPFQTRPEHADLMARVTFRDQLTHRVFTVDKAVKVRP